MALRSVAAFALAYATTASAFQGTSPLFAFSTSEQLPRSFDSPLPQIASSSKLGSQLEDLLSQCSHHNYVLVSQPGVAASDFVDQQSASWLRKYVVEKADNIAASVVIPEVKGVIDGGALSSLLAKKCGASVTKVDTDGGYISIDGKGPRVIEVPFSALPSQKSQRASVLAEHDSFLNAILSKINPDNDHIVLYLTTPPSSSSHLSAQPQEPLYEMDEPYPSAMHMDLKRDVSARAKDATDNNLGLFEKYQFLTPGIFMALVVSIPLLLILYVGIYALGSLEVSYFAFSKEMGPSAQKSKQG